jgi:carboxymethylenebutenolidase
MKDLCTKLSQAGYIAFAPDLYHGKLAHTIAEAESLSSALFTSGTGKSDVVEAVSFLHERSTQATQGNHGLAVIGFSLGAFYALEISAADPDHIRSVVVFYGTRPGDYTGSKAEYLGHFAASDEFEPETEVSRLEESLRSAGRPVTFHCYPGTGHWFFEPDRPDAYNAAAATLAWDRTQRFLTRTLAAGTP